MLISGDGSFRSQRAEPLPEGCRCEGGSNRARILYAVITRRVPYNEEEAFKPTPATTARRLHNLKNQAARLGFQLLPVPESMV